MVVSWSCPGVEFPVGEFPGGKFHNSPPLLFSPVAKKEVRRLHWMSRMEGLEAGGGKNSLYRKFSTRKFCSRKFSTRKFSTRKFSLYEILLWELLHQEILSFFLIEVRSKSIKKKYLSVEPNLIGKGKLW